MKQEKKTELRQRGLMSLLLFLLALVGITTATVAWFTIADQTRVSTISMDVTTGVALRFDLDAHSDFMAYQKTLTFEEIARRIQREKGFSLEETPLEPVTTDSGTAFTFRNGQSASAESGVYLEFTLHFMAQRDMLLHLTSNGNGGTKVSSATAGLPESMRISFTYDGETYVYDPGRDASAEKFGSGRVFGLPSADKMVYNTENTLFFLPEGVDVPVVVRVWLEGTDERCTNELKGSEYEIALRFEGTTQDHKLFSDA